MFAFFRGDRINPSYWGEKVISGRAREFDPDAALRLGAEYITQTGRDEDWSAADVSTVVSLLTSLLQGRETEHEQREVFENWGYAGGIRFSDTWEWDLTSYTYRFLWNCNAIVDIIGEYDKVKA
jgi:hypothetical protein